MGEIFRIGSCLFFFFHSMLGDVRTLYVSSFSEELKCSLDRNGTLDRGLDTQTQELVKKAEMVPLTEV